MRPEGRGMFRDAAKRPDTQAGEPQRKQWPCKYARVQSYTLNGKTPKRAPQRSHRATNCKRPKKRTFKKIRRRPERNGGDLLQMFRRCRATTPRRNGHKSHRERQSVPGYILPGMAKSGKMALVSVHRATGRQAATLRSVPE